MFSEHRRFKDFKTKIKVHWEFLIAIRSDLKPVNSEILVKFCTSEQTEKPLW